MSDKTGLISDEYHGFIEVIDGLISNTAVGEG